MKCELHIDKNTDEKVLIYAHEQNKAVEEIKSFVENQDIELVGYKDGEIEKLNPNKVNCFIIENSKIYAITDDDKYLEELGYFIGQFHNLKALDVLPYHTMGEKKYESLGMEYKLKGVPAMDKEKVVDKKAVILQGIKKRRAEMA